jgi:hypothetical protein
MGYWNSRFLHALKFSNIIIIIIIIIIIDNFFSEEDPFLWLSKGDLKAEIESEIVAAQDQALHTNYYATKLLNTETDKQM